MEEQIGALLQSGPQIIKRILRALSARDIQRVTRVCRTWQKYAAIILKERRRIVTMTATKQSQRCTQLTIVDNPETKEFLRDLDMECGLTVMFEGVGRRSLPFPLELFVANYKAMHSYLPPSSVVIGATCTSGIIGTSADGSCHEQQSPAIDCISAFLLPKLPREGTNVTHFALSLAHATKLVKTEPNMAAFAEAFKCSEDEMIKCIVLVAAEFVPAPLDQKLISAIRTVYDGQVALAGGIADEVYSSAFNQPAYVGLIFGGENARAASMVMGQEERTKERVEKRLKELKATIDGWGECKQKFGFMFACCGRGRELFRVSDVETSIFRRLMPEIPLNGMFSMGEFGWDYPQPVAVQLAKKPKRSNDAVLSYTTTFAVVGFV